MKPGPAMSARAISSLRGERRDDRLGDLARLAAHALGELQRHVGGEVAVVAVLRAIELDRDVAGASGKAVRDRLLRRGRRGAISNRGKTRRRGLNPNPALYGAGVARSLDLLRIDVERPAHAPVAGCGERVAPARAGRAAARRAMPARTRSCARSKPALRSSGAGTGIEDLDSRSRARARGARRALQERQRLALPSSTRRAAARGARRAGSPRGGAPRGASSAKRVVVVRCDGGVERVRGEVGLDQHLARRDRRGPRGPTPARAARRGARRRGSRR